jgi:hypothetical protein
MVGMHCMPERRLQRLEMFIQDYKYWCSVCSPFFLSMAMSDMTPY